MGKLRNHSKVPVGTKRNRLTLLEPASKVVDKVLMKCSCGTIKMIEYRNVFGRIPTTYSCGCYHIDNQRLNFSNIGKQNKKKVLVTDSLSYQSWSCMMQRCCNPNNIAYKYYKNRLVDQTWKVFQNFYIDMGERPSINHSLDRIDNEKGYYKENCQWILKTENSSKPKSTKRGILKPE